MSDTYSTPSDPAPDPAPDAIASLAGGSQNDLGALSGAPRASGIDALLDRATAPPDQALIDKFVGLKQQQLDAVSRQEAHTNRVLDEDRAQIKKAFNAESAMINDTPVWDQAKEAQKYKYDPVEAFGSFASVFAIIASSFTRAPMENALNGAAAAMTAMKAGKDQEYDRAFEAWQKNTDLAVKRFNMQHTALSDAFSLMQHDAQRGQQALATTLTKFGLEKELVLYQNGMIPEIQQKMAADLKAIEGIVRYKTEMERLEDQRQRTRQTENRDQLRNEIEHQKLVISQERDQAKRYLEERKLADLNDRFSKTFEIQQQKVAQGDRRLDLTEKRDEERASRLSAEQEFVKKHRAENPTESAADFSKAVGEFRINQHIQKDPTLTGAGLRADTIKKVAAPEIAKLNPEDPQYAKKVADIMLKASGQVTQAYASRGFTNNDIATLEAAPTLMKHLRTLDQFANGTIGFGRGVPEQIVAEYFGINDPAILYHAAYDGAKKAMVDLETGKRVSTQGVKAALATLPTTLTDQRFGRVQIEQAMSDLVNESRTFVGAMEASGKRIPEWTLDQYSQFGVFPPSKRDQDPLIQFRSDPKAMPDEALKTLARYKGRLPVPDQKLINDEILRRRALALRPKEQPPATPTAPDGNDYGRAR